jgi:hypothetical protein
MEAPRTASLPQIDDLFADECIVPTHDPGSYTSQPRSAASRLLQKAKLRYKISIRPVRSAGSDSTAATSQGNRSPSQQLNESQAQRQENIVDNSPSTQVLPNKLAVRELRLKLFSRKRSQTQSALPSPNGSSAHSTGGQIATVDHAPPSIVIDQSEYIPITTVPDHVEPVLTTSNPRHTTGNGTNTSQTSKCSPVSPLPIHQHSAIDQTQVPGTLSIEDSQTNAERHNPLDVAIGRGIHAILESVESTKLYSPEKGIYVGKLKELPPPERLQEEWRTTIKTELVKNLRMVLRSLPANLSLSETMVEPGLYMSGVTHGQSMVLLSPTIWLRCGSEQCRKAVQRAVADLSHVHRFPVHVTLQAARLASSDMQAPFTISRDTEPPSVEMADQILPAGLHYNHQSGPSDYTCGVGAR